MAKNCSISTVYILFIAFAVMAADFAIGLSIEAVPGGRTKVPDVGMNTEVQKLGWYSVEELNRLQRQKHGVNCGKGDLKFSKVVAADKEVFKGFLYYLKLMAFEGSSSIPKMFDAVVWVNDEVKNWKLLVKFEPSPRIIVRNASKPQK